MITEQPKTQELKITYERKTRVGVKNPRYGYCKSCGSKLTDPLGIERGYGRKCWNKFPVMIVLNISEENENLSI